MVEGGGAGRDLNGWEGTQSLQEIFDNISLRDEFGGFGMLCGADNNTAMVACLECEGGIAMRGQRDQPWHILSMRAESRTLSSSSKILDDSFVEPMALRIGC